MTLKKDSTLHLETTTIPKGRIPMATKPTSKLRQATIGLALCTALAAPLISSSAASAASTTTVTATALVQSHYTFAGLADWDRDGRQDIVARDPAGVLWLYPGTGIRGYSNQGRTQIGHGW